MIEKNGLYRINKFVGHRKYRDKLVVLNTNMGLLYIFDGLEMLIWNEICKSKSINEISKNITKKYNIDQSEAENDLSDFILEMVNEGLIDEN